MPPKIYTPSRSFVSQSAITSFLDSINKTHSLSLSNYSELHNYSITHPNTFWLDLWTFLPIKASSQPTHGVNESLPITSFPEFYTGSRLNYAENMLSRTGPDIAVKALTESTLHCPEEVSWDALREKVRSYASASKNSGFAKGDVMVVIGGSTITSLVLYLACASIGGVVACFAHDAGERMLSERVGVLKPKLVFVCRGYRYNGKWHDISTRVEKMWEQIEDRPEGAEVICTDEHESESSTPDTWIALSTFLARDSGKELEFEQVHFHTPFVVMFSSGTTGPPKGIVHSQGGLIVNGMKEHILHYNHDYNSVHYHYAGIGWTLWNIMLGALFCGSQIVLYDGSPFYPDAETLLKGVLATGVTSFGAGPRYFNELMKAGVDARRWTGRVDKIPSAGALLTESLSLWIKSSFSEKACQISTSGGTELCGNFVHGWQGAAVHAGENAVICLGMDVDIFLLDGTSAPLGTSGELVCKKPFPNMPVCFWNDEGKKKYHATYFETFPGVWCHGDFIRMNPETGGLVISGRSDGVLNPSGIRFGSGEIYTIIEREAIGEVIDAICVGQQRSQDETERVFLFLQMRDGRLGSELKSRIREAITMDLSRRHVPSFMFAVEQIPYNVNGKKLEIPLRAVLSEGKEAFAKRKFTVEERQVLEKFLKYFRVEEVVHAQDRVKSKL